MPVSYATRLSSRSRPLTRSRPSTFTFLSYDEHGMMIGPTGAHRLVCVTGSGAKVVMFGRKRALKNINAFLDAGRLDAAVFDQLGQGQLGDFPAHRVKAG